MLLGQRIFDTRLQYSYVLIIFLSGQTIDSTKKKLGQAPLFTIVLPDTFEDIKVFSLSRLSQYLVDNMKRTLNLSAIWTIKCQKQVLNVNTAR